MKTLHLHRHAPPAPPAPRPSVRAPIVRLGILVSAVAAVAAIVLEALLDVPAVLILVPVVVVGFTLSWHASGRPERLPPDGPTASPIVGRWSDEGTHRRRPRRAHEAPRPGLR